MQEPEPMKQIHNIQKEIYEETKHMSPKEFIDYVNKKTAGIELRRRNTKTTKSLEAFFAELNKKKKAG